MVEPLWTNLKKCKSLPQCYLTSVDDDCDSAVEIGADGYQGFLKIKSIEICQSVLINTVLFALDILKVSGLAQKIL